MLTNKNDVSFIIENDVLDKTNLISESFMVEYKDILNLFVIYGNEK